MSSLIRAFIVGSLAAALPMQGVYAPIPENPEQIAAQEKGDKHLTVTVKAGLAHDSNLFGAASNEVGTAVWTLAPRAAFNVSHGKTFMSASYGLTLDQFDNRPGDKLLDSHDGVLRLAHKFSEATTIDLNDSLMVTRNPESLLAGVKLNTDQSFTRNQVDGKLVTPVVSERISVAAKLRSVFYEYRDAALGRNLDRIENLYGISADYQGIVSKKLKTVAEYRHQDVYYSKLGESKNKASEYVMGGFDYDVEGKLSLSGRLGVEWRSRAAERSTNSPYAEFSAKYDYDKNKSFLSGGFGYALEETSDTARFNDTKVYRGFVNLQHWLTAHLAGSASLTYEPSSLQGRRGQVNVDEKSLRSGVSLSFLPTKNWTLSASFDFDRVRSDDVNRNLDRKRYGLNAVYTF